MVCIGGTHRTVRLSNDNCSALVPDSNACQISYNLYNHYEFMITILSK